MRQPPLSFPYPPWFERFMEDAPLSLPTEDGRAAFAIDLARLNVENATGGPFGAAVFDGVTGELLGAGVNLVLFASSSALHAEMVALMAAQKAVGNWDLGGCGTLVRELYASSEPCAMCLGALPWSGVGRLVTSATREDVLELGFDEGDRSPEWIEALARLGVEVRREVFAEGARRVLGDYARGGGMIYNPPRRQRR